jgi:NAD(P)-dependent dehydrogenase (short-subunit alcohol dehydrogenase family)
LESLGAKVSRLSWQHDFASLGKDHGYRSLIFVWPGPDRDPGLISQAMLALRQLGPKLKGMVGVTSLGGSFSYPRGDGAAPSGNPASAALSGLVKTAAREWPEVRARVIDLPLAAHEAHIPGIQERVGELLFAKGPVEVGLTGGDRTVRPALVPFRLPSGHPGAPPLSPGDTLVATGGGRGVTSVILLELARLYRPKVVILGRTPLGPPEPAWLKGLNTEKGIVRAIHKATSGVLKPLELKARAALTMRARELRNTLSALDDLGCEAEYLGGDFLDPVFLEETLRAVRTKHGPIKGLLHGAGVISDKPILEKDPGDFRRVFDTKVGLASRLLEAFQDEPLGLIVFMSSTTARLGRDGQGDYAAANEVLNKMAWDEAENRPDAKVLSIMWGPWDGGMVDEGLAKKFLSEGIGLIAPDSGAKAFASLMGLPKGHPAELLLLGYGTDLGRVLAADLAKGANPAQGYPALRAKSQGSRG